MPHPPIDPHRALWRVVIATVAGLLAAAAAWESHASAFAVLLGWNMTAFILLGLSWLPIATADASATQRRAGSEDPGRTFVYVIVVIASAASLFAAVSLSRHPHHVAPGESGAIVGLCLSTVALAWGLTHTAFTLRYARLYYREDGEGIGGVEFPGRRHPSYFDFAYFSFTIGMCFQVSDACISSAQIRRAALLHAIIAFAYNTALLAFVLNLVFGSVSDPLPVP